jgi:hypothetical protein
MAYFNQDRNLVRVETAYCLDYPFEATSIGYWYYPGEYRFSLLSSTNYNIDRNDATDQNIDNLKAARILWLIKQAATATPAQKNDIQLAIWSTQSSSTDDPFTAGSYAQQAQTAVPTVPTPPEPTFSMNFPSGENGVALVGTGEIQINIPFSWSAVQAGQTDVVKLEIPTGVTITSVTGGSIDGQNLTITPPSATITLKSTVVGKFTIKAVYDNPTYYNVSNLNIYTPCTAVAPAKAAQAFLHIGEENLASPFRSISAEWIDPLPVRLVTFDATLENNVANLQWNTVDEVDFSHFEVQKSTDTKNWATLSNVSSNPSGNYRYTDGDLLSMSTAYYRLKMVDNDNTYSYSTIKSVAIKNPSITADIYPNPVVDKLNFTNLDMQNVSNVMLYDQAGIGKTISHQLKQNTFDVSSLNNGIYIIHFNLKNGQSLVHKFVVKR